jgi:hypothetical protein
VPRTRLTVVALLVAPPAFASWPNDLSISGMARHDGALITDPVTDDYVQLVRELGAGLSSWSQLPASTTGVEGFDVALGSSFWLIDAYSEDGPTPWQRAHPDETPPSYQWVPSLVARKGLPLSTEVGAGVSWFAGSSSGAVHAFARASLLEGDAPLPELAVQIGYTALVGNDELELGVFEAGATIGANAPLQRYEDVTQSELSPYLGVTFLRTRAAPVLDADVAERVGAVAIGGPDAPERALSGIRVAGGVQIESGPALARLGASWTTGTPVILSIATGVGF